MVGIRLRLAVLPDQVLVGPSSGSCRSAGLGVAEVGHDHGRALGAVGVVGVGLPAAGHVPREGEQLGAVGEGVLDRVVVEEVAGLADSSGRPCPGPTTGQAFLAQQATSTLWQCQSMKNPPLSPVEADGVLELEDQLVGVLGQRGAVDRPVDAVDPQRVHVADRPVVDPLDDLLPGLASAAT